MPPLPSPKERRRLREAKSLSQAEVAAEMGVSRSAVRAWESGRRHPRGRSRVAYAHLLAGLADGHAPGASGTGAGRGEAHPPTSAATRKAAGTVAYDQEAAGPEAGAAGPEAGRRPEAVAERDPEAAPAAGVDPEDAAPAATAPAAEDPDAAPDPMAAPDRYAKRPVPSPHTPEAAFDALCTRTAPSLVRQAYALTGRPGLAEESVERAFQLAWQRWPEVAMDRDPASWVRAAAHEYALSPWHRFRRAHRTPGTPPAEAAHRAVLTVLLSLPPARRRTLLLYDGIGLDLPETAAETEATTPTAAYRLLHARRAVAEALPDAEGEPEVLHRHLDALGRTERLRQPRPERVRLGSERRARLWTRAAIAFTALIIGATALTVRTAPTRYEPAQAPGRAISGVPPRMGPGPLSYEDEVLREKLRAEPHRGPGRLLPVAG
ncbi:hypothetical protein STRAU_4528 [Streptomyces aurantiacus JA 4570]|uniref:HTH cro/C1-type domain-containing protein n=2 Tax=Streptomyces aurantiacus TaxID=47760 RepID=S3ZVH0_9ACTN|nr:hypothetical protein STRAU_4528 [Streptomyces aurantiacus JA 4570]